jgi:hypothetical protein
MSENTKADTGEVMVDAFPYRILYSDFLAPRTDGDKAFFGHALNSHFPDVPVKHTIRRLKELISRG